MADTATTHSGEETLEAKLEGMLDIETFDPPEEFRKEALLNDPSIYEEAERDWKGWWLKQAKELHWFEEPSEVLDDSNPPFYKWFKDGKINASYNCLDRHVEAGKGSKIAYYYEGEPGDRWTITYRQLLDDVSRFANGLRALGIRKGDRIAIYMPMIPELPVAMLACSRIGAPHSVIFGGFSPDAIVDRVNDAQCVALVTADQGWRRGNKIPLKANCDRAMEQTPSIRHCIVAKRVGDAVAMREGRDVWWNDVVAGQSQTCEPERMNAEDLLYLLYTSGTTAKPKGIKHTTGGYLTHVTATHKLVFDLKEDEDVYWCAADIGWVTGHSYIVYGPLANGATSVIYEGTPDCPDKDRLWSIVERYKVSILYTAPTAIRTFMKWGDRYPASHDMSSLRLLGSVGEPINPEAWMWYRKHIGGNRCPIVDTWWQTETGGIMISPLPGITETPPGSATKPLPGIAADIVNDRGESVPLGGGGYVVLTRPWPGVRRGFQPMRSSRWRWSGRAWRRSSIAGSSSRYLPLKPVCPLLSAPPSASSASATTPVPWPPACAAREPAPRNTCSRSAPASRCPCSFWPARTMFPTMSWERSCCDTFGAPASSWSPTRATPSTAVPWTAAWCTAAVFARTRSPRTR